jgi:hypothetical protein
MTKNDIGRTFQNDYIAVRTFDFRKIVQRIFCRHDFDVRHIGKKTRAFLISVENSYSKYGLVNMDLLVPREIQTQQLNNSKKHIILVSQSFFS